MKATVKKIERALLPCKRDWKIINTINQQQCIYANFADSTLRAHKLVWLFLFRLIADWQSRVRSLKAETCSIVWVSFLITPPKSLSCNHDEARGGTVYNMTLQGDDLTGRELSQECTLAYGWKAINENWPVEFFYFFNLSYSCTNERITFVMNVII